MNRLHSADVFVVAKVGIIDFRLAEIVTDVEVTQRNTLRLDLFFDHEWNQQLIERKLQVEPSGNVSFILKVLDAGEVPVRLVVNDRPPPIVVPIDADWKREMEAAMSLDRPWIAEPS